MAKAPEKPVVYTVKEVAEMLKISVTSVMAAVKSGRLVAKALGERKGYRVLAEDLDKWVRAPQVVRERSIAVRQEQTAIRGLELAIQVDPEHADKHVASFNRRRARCHAKAH